MALHRWVVPPMGISDARGNSGEVIEASWRMCGSLLFVGVVASAGCCAGCGSPHCSSTMALHLWVVLPMRISDARGNSCEGIESSSRTCGSSLLPESSSPSIRRVLGAGWKMAAALFWYKIKKALGQASMERCACSLTVESSQWKTLACVATVAV